MFLPHQTLRFVNSIAHEGKTLVFGTAPDGKIYYTIPQRHQHEARTRACAGGRVGDERCRAHYAAESCECRIVQLGKVQTTLSQRNTAFLEGITKTQQRIQAMPEIHRDRRGLVVKGARL